MSTTPLLGGGNFIFILVTMGYKAIYNKKCRGNQIKFNFIIIQASKMKEQVRKILHRIKYVLRTTNQTDMEQNVSLFVLGQGIWPFHGNRNNVYDSIIYFKG